VGIVYSTQLRSPIFRSRDEYSAIGGTIREPSRQLVKAFGVDITRRLLGGYEHYAREAIFKVKPLP
jgi:hypothetical protein